MLRRDLPANGGVLLEHGSSRSSFRELKPGVVLIVAAGPGDQSLNETILQELTAAIERSSPITVFADMSKLTGIALGSVDGSIRWIRRHRAGIAAGHLLVSHVAVGLLVSMIRTAFSGAVRSYTQPALFEAAIRAHVPDFRS